MYLLRHGQSYFNLHFNETRRDPGIEDPELTPLGHEQARAAAEKLRGKTLTRIVVSPYTRALQTAEPLRAARGVAVEVMQVVRERTWFVCDIGSHPEVLAERFPQHEFGHLPGCWWYDGHESEAETLARAEEFRALMVQREDAATTLVVSHWAFLLALSGVSVENGEMVEYDPRRAGGRR
jgi:broad specificity phosphatase PhoE